MNYLNRRKGQAKARRVLRVWRGAFAACDPDYADDDSHIAYLLLHTRKPCSQLCCGNPRRWLGERTLQERRAEDEFEHEMLAWELATQDDFAQWEDTLR